MRRGDETMNTTLTPYSEAQERAIAASGYRVRGRSRLGGMAIDNLSAVMAAAAKTTRRDGTSVFVYATAGGYQFGPARPPFGQSHFELTPAGYRKID
jgi:hypothetical protein